MLITSSAYLGNVQSTNYIVQCLFLSEYI